MKIDIEDLREWLNSQSYDIEEHGNDPYVIGWRHAVMHVLAELPVLVASQGSPSPELAAQPAPHSPVGTGTPNRVLEERLLRQTSRIERGLCELCDAHALDEETSPKQRFDVSDSEGKP